MFLTKFKKLVLFQFWFWYNIQGFSLVLFYLLVNTEFTHATLGNGVFLQVIICSSVTKWPVCHSIPHVTNFIVITLLRVNLFIVEHPTSLLVFYSIHIQVSSTTLDHTFPEHTHSQWSRVYCTGHNASMWKVKQNKNETKRNKKKVYQCQ